MSRATANRTTCPRCKWNLLKGLSARNAVSRRDNKTMICAECGTQESLEDSRLIPKWLDDPKNMPYWDTSSELWMIQCEKLHDKESGVDKLKGLDEVKTPHHTEMGGDSVILSNEVES